MAELLLFYIPFPDNDIIQTLSDKIISEGKGACTQIISANSQYLWEESLQSETERILIIKTLPELKDALITFLKDHHPYKVPCIMYWPVQVNDSYYDWVVSNCRK